jgi:tellurite resistance protein TehA-like permease
MHYQVNFTYILYALFFGGVLTQLIYLLFIFTRLIRHRDFESNYEGQTFPPVSIIIAAMNELKILKLLLRTTAPATGRTITCLTMKKALER